MKILAYDKNKSVADLSTEFEQMGISSKRLTGALGASYLPKFGKFEAYGVDGDTGKNDDGSAKLVDGKPVQNTMHIRIGTAKMADSISVSRLQLDIFKGEATEKNLLVSSKGNYYLPANTIVNPGLKGNQANIVHKLMNKHFAAEKIDGLTTAYNPDGYKNPEDVEFRPVSVYKIHLFDTLDEAKTFAETLPN